jgi:hypothetical protein
MSEDCKKELETQADESAAGRQIGIGKMRVGPYEDAGSTSEDNGMLVLS